MVKRGRIKVLITQSYITNKTRRPGRKILKVLGIAVSVCDETQNSALKVRDGFNEAVAIHSAQFIVEWDTGKVIETMPDDEVALNLGLNADTEIKNSICGKEDPDDFIIGVACCLTKNNIGDGESGIVIVPSVKQYESLVSLCAYLCQKYGLDPLYQLFRRCDISGEGCGVWLMAQPAIWEKFKSDVLSVL